MKFTKDEIRKGMLFYVVTDRSWLKAGEKLSDVAAEALRGGATFLQIREKDLTEADFLAEALALKKLSENYAVPFVVNDSVEIAMEIDADGVHVGQSDIKGRDIRSIIGEDKILGVSVGTVEEAMAAEKAGADYIGVGAVFSTSTKKNARSMTMELLQEIVSNVSIPVVAIGGITKENMLQLKGTGVDGVALVSAIFAAEDIEQECRELKALSMQMVHKGKTMKAVLSIAGSDCSGGAGIQADLKTMTMNGVYAMSAITALTAQNTMGVSAISEVSPAFLAQQLDAVFEDIRPDGVKIGMVSSAELISVIAEKLKAYQAKNIVVDPVMVSTSGSALMKTEAVSALVEKLLPLSTLVTPNIPEAEVLSGMTIKNEAEMEAAAKRIGEAYGCAVLLKGGHSINDANDLLYHQGEYKWFYGIRIQNPNTHGTGCTLSSAIASNLAKGFDLETAVQKGKAYISGALADMLDLGRGSGPMNHAFDLQGDFSETKG